MNFDYKLLLIKYIQHVGDINDDDFIAGIETTGDFTPPEVMELNNLSNEAYLRSVANHK